MEKNEYAINAIDHIITLIFTISNYISISRPNLFIWFTTFNKKSFAAKGKAIYCFIKAKILINETLNGFEKLKGRFYRMIKTPIFQRKNRLLNFKKLSFSVILRMFKSKFKDSINCSIKTPEVVLPQSIEDNINIKHIEKKTVSDLIKFYEQLRV